MLAMRLRNHDRGRVSQMRFVFDDDGGMMTSEMIVKGFLQLSHEGKIRICLEMGLITGEDTSMVGSWFSLWRKALREVAEKNLHSQLWDALYNSGVVTGDNPYEVASLMAELEYNVSKGFISKSEVEREWKELHDPLWPAGVPVTTQKLNCHRCHREWTVTAQSDGMINCPACDAELLYGMPNAGPGETAIERFRRVDGASVERSAPGCCGVWLVAAAGFTGPS